MTANEYFKHARKLGAFRACDVLELAREAAALDGAAQARRANTPAPRQSSGANWPRVLPRQLFCFLVLLKV